MRDAVLDLAAVRVDAARVGHLAEREQAPRGIELGARVEPGDLRRGLGRDHLAGHLQQVGDLIARDPAAGDFDGRLDERHDEAGDAEAVVGQVAHLGLVNDGFEIAFQAVRPQQFVELPPRLAVEVLRVPEGVVGVEGDQVDHEWELRITN